MDIFDEQGRYIKTEWGTGDRITSPKINKIETALERISDTSLYNHETISATVQDILDNHETISATVQDIEDRISPIEIDRSEKYGVHKITRKTKKIFDDGCVLNVNNTGKAAEVCGFRNHQDLSIYPDRDSVIMYVDGVLPKCEILNVVEFGVDYVRYEGNISEVEVGMIVDCMNQSEIDEFYQETKYSGFITGFNDNTIYVSGWYQYKNSESGQIPDKDRIIINPVTRLWGTNINVFLPEDSFGWGGVGCEYGLWNSKSPTTGKNYYQLCGVDVANFEGCCGAGYIIRKANADDTTIILVGYISKEAEEGFVSENSNVAGFVSRGDKVGFNADVEYNDKAFKTNNDKFAVYGDGTIGSFYPRRHVYTTTFATIEPDKGYFHFVDGGDNQLPNPANYGACNIKIVAKTDCRIMGNMLNEQGVISSYNLTAWRTLELYSDATYWIIIHS